MLRLQGLLLVCVGVEVARKQFPVPRKVWASLFLLGCERWDGLGSGNCLGRFRGRVEDTYLGCPSRL